LIKQFIGESVLFSLIAALFAILLARLALPFFRSLVDRDIQMRWLSDPWIPVIVFGMVLFAGMLSGSYPALFLSSFRPIIILKGSLERAAGKKGLRNVLVVFQFAVAVCLIIGTLIVSQQIRFIRNTDIGYDREHVIVMPLRDDLARKNGNFLSEELRRHDKILAVSGSEYIPLERNNIYGITFTKAAGESVSVNAYTCEIGYEFLDVFGIQIIEGRNFSREFRTDEQYAVLLNQTAVQSLGMKDPVGKVLENQGFHVIGVVRDYHHSSLHDKIEPMIFFLRPNAYTFLSVRIKPGDISGTLAYLKETVKKHSPYFAFEYYFQDDYFNEKYNSDQRFGKAIGFASGLAIMIACLGIFGLISFSTERHTKEIAIRKVLGASVRSILGRLAKEFILLVALANLLAWPIAYYFMKTWLQNFAFRINMTIWTFLIAAGLSLAISVLAVSYKSLQAATANPVDSLRYE
jgi:putative ABC transport system permease protein